MDRIHDEQLPAEIATLLKARYNNAMVYLAADSGDWVLMTIGCCDLQGDKAAPDRFLQAYDPRIAQWVRETTVQSELDLFSVTEPVTKCAVDASFVTYADNLGRLGVHTGAESGAKKIADWDDKLLIYVSDPNGLFQNIDKNKLCSDTTELEHTMKRTSFTRSRCSSKVPPHCVLSI